MATRKTAPKGRKPGPRLRSQGKVTAVMQDDEDWKSDGSAESVIPGAKPEEGMVSLMQHFLNAQQRREERFLLELRGLRESIVEAARPNSDGESPRLELPTPAASRVASQRRAGYHRDSPGVPVLRGPPQRMEPTMPSLQPGDDIENYLRRFERLARTWRWPEEEWSCRLVPLLTGRALEAYLAMDEEQAKVYDELKKALLEKYDISPETYRQRFRSATFPAGESPTETYHRLKNLYERWVRPREHSKEAIILEQLLRVLPVETRTWVREHEPTAGVAAAKLAQQYLNAHRGTLRTQPPSGTGRTHPGVERRGAMPADSAPGWNPPGGRPKELVCFYCQQTGHKASVCPARKAKLSGYCYVPREGDVELRRGRESLSACHVTVNGCCLQALLDTGSALSMVKSGFGSNVDYVNTVGVQCVHGDVKRYPQAEVLLEVQGQTYLLKVAVVASLPTDMILGRDLPVLCDLLQSTERSTGNVDSVLPGHLSCPAFTRAQARAGLQPLPDMDESLLQGGDRGPKKSRRLKRLEKYLGTPTSEVAAEHPEGIGWQEPENIAELQKGDVTLKAMFEKAMSDQPSNLCEEKSVVKNDILYVQAGDKSRLVVPASCHPLVLHLAHSVPWAGHLGQQKTFARVSSRFHWPTLYADVRTYCNSCPTCQKTSAVPRQHRAPLHPLPVLSEPFRRIAMDIVGPLEKSSAGHRYILVISDYATRYPEAFPLRTATSPNIVPALVQLFSRVGIPEEILTDQGTNFTSRLMGQLYRQLGITAIKTTPYHPQTDGLVERFNQTLKNMLRKFVVDTGKDWDKWLPFVLFAYREVPQASTGFSPFELLYGWQVRGPLDLLRESWEEGMTAKPEERGIVQYVLEMRERLEQYRDQARENLQATQRYQKRWYDQHARLRQYQPGQRVLLLLPTSTSKLLAKWQGPYTVVRKMGPVTYEVHHPDKGKAKQTYHVNLLKEWKESPEKKPQPCWYGR
ncbi:uncharacterized protein LOC129604626 [Betta splendens]|uniref:Gypsy retrotransposon integrase-like protein 1 n=1 Tax=Betta splendens TaxID=158456 RepID=A0A9W2Y1Z0_BETSP|nr:uncharacterized protein LOC129604626 [Betta splendens]